MYSIRLYLNNRLLLGYYSVINGCLAVDDLPLLRIHCLLMMMCSWSTKHLSFIYLYILHCRLYPVVYSWVSPLFVSRLMPYNDARRTQQLRSGALGQ